MAKKSNDSNVLNRLFPGFASYEKEPTQVDISSQTAIAGGSAYLDYMQDPLWPTTPDSGSTLPRTDAEYQQQHYFRLQSLPYDRLGKYPFYRLMNTDSTISTALKQHIISALTVSQATNEIASIEARDGNDKDKYVNELRDAFKDVLNQRSHEFAYNAALYGNAFVRLYGKQGVGIIPQGGMRHDYYCYPGHITKWEQAGRRAGYTSIYQNMTRDNHILLMPPWTFAEFRLPLWDNDGMIEPRRTDGKTFNIDDEDFESEPVVESQNYGESLLAHAFDSWWDLQEAILSLNLSRKNAARLEKIWGVQTGGLSPQKAQQYLNIIAEQLHKTNNANHRSSLRRGWVQTMIHHLIPIWSKDGKGRLEVSGVEPSPDIQGIEDIMFHLRRLCSSIGSTPSLLGFSEEMQGGLGEGGWARVSMMAALFSTLIRTAMTTGWMQVFDIHIALKFGKFFLPKDRPWQIQWNSVSTALEREAEENNSNRMMFATSFLQLMELIDPQRERLNGPEVANYTLTEILKVPEDVAKTLFKAKNPPDGSGPIAEIGEGGFGGVENMGGGGQAEGGGDDQAQPQPKMVDYKKSLLESARTRDEMKEFIYNTISDFYEADNDE